MSSATPRARLLRSPLAWAALFVCLTLARFATAAPDSLSPADEAALRRAVTPALLTRIAIERNPGLSGFDRRAAATEMRGDAESRLPPPEAEVLVQSVPLGKPYDVPGAQMIMLGLRQPIPAPGSLSAMRDMRVAQGSELRAEAAVMRRELAREVAHAFVEYWEAHARAELLRRDKAEADRIAAFAKARYVAGGPLTDLTQADVESEMIAAALAGEEAKADAARSGLNALLLRRPNAPMGPPEALARESVGESADELSRKALSLRPEIHLARTRQAAMQAEARVARREADWPMMAVGLFYYAPTRDMPGHGYGASFMSQLPWAWGRASDQARASRAMASAADSEIADAGAKAATEIAMYAGAALASERRLVALRDRALPASHRAASAASAGYESGRTDILMLLSARRAVVQIEAEILEARAMIHHALVDLDWAAGAPVRRRALPDTPLTTP